MSPVSTADYRTAFVDFMLEADVLRFGDFVTKSGRRTPYFVNTGNYNTGPLLEGLGEFYAAAIADRFGLEVDNLYGPAYKGIPLAVTTSAALWRCHAKKVSVTFNRKEAKDHGEGGDLIGYRYQGGERALIVEDVMTAGTSIRESMPRLLQAGVTVVGVIISVDRQECGRGTGSALREIEVEFGFPVRAIVSIDEIVETLRQRRTADGEPFLGPDLRQRIADYRRQYGA